MKAYPKTNEPKHEMDYNDNDEKIMSLNTKAINILFGALDAVEFNKVSDCRFAKKV